MPTSAALRGKTNEILSVARNDGSSSLASDSSEHRDSRLRAPPSRARELRSPQSPAEADRCAVSVVEVHDEDARLRQPSHAETTRRPFHGMAFAGGGTRRTKVGQ
jgi:hypothetical protein